MPVSLFSRSRLERVLQTAEAAVMLFIALALVRVVRMQHWRKMFGQTGDGAVKTRACQRKVTDVRAAIDRVERLLGIEFKCLARAMAMQAMLRHRNIPSALVVGVGTDLPASGKRPLHAWIDVDGEVAIGQPAVGTFVPLLVLAQP